MDELIAQFVLESRELIQQASDDLLALEATPGDRARLESAFRAFHTLKGSVGLFDFGPMLAILHRAEDLLAQARSGRLTIDDTLIEPLLAVLSWIDDSIDGISQTGRLTEGQLRQAPRLLNILQGELSGPEINRSLDRLSANADWAERARDDRAINDAAEATVAIRYEPHADCYFNGDDPLATMSRVPGLLHVTVTLKDTQTRPANYDPFRCNLIIVGLASGSLSETEAIFRLIPDQVTVVPLSAARPAQDTASRSGAEQVRQRSTMRVDVDRIDKLIEIAVELVAAKNSLVGLAEEARGHGHSTLAKKIASSHHELEHLVGSLYGAVAHARMIPLEQAFQRFPRLVRDLSGKLEKPVDLVIEGETVEADREIVEGLFEPLLHLIRNSLDHGLEDKADRAKTAKPAKGRILLRARQRADQISIELADDGRGIDTARVRRKAVEKGLVTAGELQNLSDADILKFVFAPGFSTAATVSDLSGRGVGLDAVQRSIHQLGGTLELTSEPGAGTSFNLALPVSFSMTQLMVVEVAGERYGIPIADVIETHRITAAAIQPIRAGKAFVRRGTATPLLFLAEVLRLREAVPYEGHVKVLVVQSGGDEVGLVVDTIAERTETVTKPLTGLLRDVPGIAGTTLLGDGRILLVLDVEELLS